MKRQQFRITTRTGAEPRTGYALGDYATHKDRGAFFWTFTHLPTGYTITTYPVHQTRASALAHLAHLAAHGLPPHQQAAVDAVLAQQEHNQ